MPDGMSYNQCFKVEWIGLWSFASSAKFTWPLANQFPLLQASQQLFAGKTLPQPEGCRKRFPRVCWIPKHRFVCWSTEAQHSDAINRATRMNKLLICKNVLIVMVPILINKGVPEPSYNDSKFTARNCNFVCTNLIVTTVWGEGA